MDLTRHVTQFLEQHVPEKSLLLLGFSGGIDSTALLMALASVKERWPLHVVHIDHGWRKESFEEALSLGQRITALDIPFSSFQLGKPPKGENLEDWSRNERYRCFQVAATQLKTPFFILAHQANDQTECVFKRMLEGSSLTKFRGMKARDERDGLTLLRPLLDIQKDELLEWLQARKISFFEDPSNSNCAFLRARMREEIFPFLRTRWGKNFEQSLLRVSKEAGLLEEYVQQQLQERFQFREFHGGIVATATPNSSLHPFIVSRLIDFLVTKAQFCLSRMQLERAADVFCSASAQPKQFFAGAGALYAEPHCLTVFRRAPAPLSEKMCEAEEGSFSYHSWEIAWRKAVCKKSAPHHWTDLFSSNELSFYIPAEPFTICGTSDRLLRDLPRAVEKSPSALRRFVPALLQGGHVVVDLLSGYQIPMPLDESCLEITISQSASTDR